MAIEVFIEAYCCRRYDAILTYCTRRTPRKLSPPGASGQSGAPPPKCSRRLLYGLSLEGRRALFSTYPCNTPLSHFHFPHTPTVTVCLSLPARPGGTGLNRFNSGDRSNMTTGHWMQALCLISFTTLLCALRASAQAPPALNLMPIPAEVQQGTGNLHIDASFSVALTGYTEARLNRTVQRFQRQLFQQTAIPLRPKPEGSSGATLTIHTDRASKEIQELGEDESYTLEVTPQGARLNAATPLGTMHGLQTFLQLVDVSSGGFAVPAVKINDRPRFPWRGLMIDSGRHFTPLDVLKRNLDGLEAVKMNVFHWHLSENQGFRVESKKFPKLHELGSDHLYYTQEEVRDLIAYARDRGIRV